MEKKLFENIRFTRLVKALMLSYFLTMLYVGLDLSFGLYKFELKRENRPDRDPCGLHNFHICRWICHGKNGKDKEIPAGIYAWNAIFSAVVCNFSRDLPERAGWNADDDRWILCGAGGMLGGMVS
mgnify:CR=1 FL=1